MREAQKPRADRSLLSFGRIRRVSMAVAPKDIEATAAVSGAAAATALVSMAAVASVAAVAAMAAAETATLAALGGVVAALAVEFPPGDAHGFSPGSVAGGQLAHQGHLAGAVLLFACLLVCLAELSLSICMSVYQSVRLFLFLALQDQQVAKL